MSRRAASALLCLLLSLVIGCGGGASDKFKKARQKTAKATGAVMYRGQPLADAVIVCFPTLAGDKAVAASAYTDANGNFSLEAYPPEKGAVPGDYQITIQKNAPAEARPAPPPGVPAHDVPAPPPPRPLIPAKYGKIETSGLTLKVPEAGIADIKIELVD
ncbi:MAG: hypothetical protein JWP89_4468 [Schlesneria sp.]|nr:hypothetical protein [Schlesneria sp.]